MSSAPPAFIRQLHGRMARSMLLIFLPISLLPVLVVGSMVYLFAGTLLMAETSLAERPLSVDQALLEQFPTNFRLVGSLIFILVLVLVGVFIWLAARYLTRPLNDLVFTMNLFSQGNWEQRALIDKPNEIGTLARLFNRMADELSETNRALSSLESERGRNTTEGGNGRQQAIARLSQLAILGTDLDDFLDRALDLIIRNYNCCFAGLYVMEKAGPLGPSLAVLRHSISSPEFEASTLASRPKEKAVDIDIAPSTDWLVGKAIASMRAQVSMPQEAPNMVEAAIPITSGEKLLGIFNLFAINQTSDSRASSFSSRILAELQTVANIVALAITSAALQEAENLVFAATETTQELTVKETNLVYQASQHMALAETAEQVFDGVTQILQGSPYASSILMAEETTEPDMLRLVYRGLPQHAKEKDQAFNQSAKAEPSLSITSIAPYFMVPERLTPRPLIVTDLRTSPLPQELLEVPRQMSCESAAFIPVIRAEKIVALLVLGRGSTAEKSRATDKLPTGKNLPPLTMPTLAPYITLIELMVMTLEKLQAQQGTQRRLAELQTMWNISQTISVETNLDTLFQVIHQQVEAVMGELNSFAIAMYNAPTDTISVPYLVESGQQIQVPPFPLGEGLTSIVIRTRNPLMLVEDTEAKARELGAKVIGVPARSWLGVPLLFGGEVIGAVIVQDTIREHRFNEEDKRLLSTLATQVAVVVRNTWLLDTTRRRAQQERLLNDITEKIRQSVDIQTILKTTADELGIALAARKAHIELAQPGLSESSVPKGHKTEMHP